MGSTTMQSGALATVHIKEPSPIMTESTLRVNNGRQLSMDSSSAIEITLRIGVMLEDDHVQFEIEVKDAIRDELIKLESRPHVVCDDAMVELSGWMQKCKIELWDALGPF